MSALASHAGNCSIDMPLNSISDTQARVLELFNGNLCLNCTKISPSVARCLARKSGLLHLLELENLDLEVAGYLSKLSGPLVLGDVLFRCEASSEAIEVLVKTLPCGDLNFEPCELSDTACEALAGFGGDVSFLTFVNDTKTEMTEKGALLLAKRKSLGVLKTKIPKEARKIFETYGSWDGDTWSRKP